MVSELLVSIGSQERASMAAVTFAERCMFSSEKLQ
jgi:hypothetical protein